MRIKAGRNNYQIGFVALNFWYQFIFHCGKVIVIICVGIHWKVQCGAQPISSTGFSCRPCAGIKRVLMRATVINGWVIIKRVLGAVAMMHVPIENKNLVQSFYFLRVSGGYCHIVEQAEPHCMVLLGMVPRWAHSAKGVMDTTIDELINGTHSCPGA